MSLNIIWAHFVLSMFAITAAATVAACHHISCHMHMHFYVFEQFAANLLYVDAIAPFGRNSFIPQSCVMFFRAESHTRSHILEKWKFCNSGCTLSLRLINSGTRWTAHAYVCIRALYALRVRTGNWIHIWTSFTFSCVVCSPFHMVEWILYAFHSHWFFFFFA